MFEKETVEVTCPKCGQKSQENVGRLKGDGYTCPECGTTLDAKQLARALKEAEGGVEKLKAEIAKLRSAWVSNISSSSAFASLVSYLV